MLSTIDVFLIIKEGMTFGSVYNPGETYTISQIEVRRIRIKIEFKGEIIDYVNWHYDVVIKGFETGVYVQLK